MEPLCSDREETKWNAIVFTCQSRESANCFQKGTVFSTGIVTCYHCTFQNKIWFSK